jgi:hypothetical protein
VHSATTIKVDIRCVEGDCSIAENRIKPKVEKKLEQVHINGAAKIKIVAYMHVECSTGKDVELNAVVDLDNINGWRSYKEVKAMLPECCFGCRYPREELSRNR